MVKMIVLDTELLSIIDKERDKLAASGCSNPSYSNTIRTMLDLPHISGRGRRDVCGQKKEKTLTRVDLSSDEKGKEKELNED